MGFGHDPQGKLASAGQLALVRHPQHGRLSSWSLGGVSGELVYDGFGGLSSLGERFAGEPLYAASYTRDKLGRVVETVETIQGETRTLTYRYDLRGRLEEVLRNGTSVELYAYDANGNRTSATGPAGTRAATYDEQDRLLTLGERTYTHSPAGERTSQRQGTAELATSYDGFGNLLSATLPDGREITYLIDGLNRRIGKRVEGSLVQGFLYSSQLAPVAELGPSGEVVSRFVYGSRIVVPDYLERAGRTYRLVTDPVGSVRLVVDTATGEVAQRLDYDAFGQVLLDTNPGFQPFGFAGGLYDKDPGLLRFGVRDHGPEVRGL